MEWKHFCAVLLCAACGGDERGTVVTGLDITQSRIEVQKRNGSIEEVVDEEIFLANTNRATVYLTIMNESDGWWPYNIELCVDHPESIGIIQAGWLIGEADGLVPSDDPSRFTGAPCTVYFSEEYGGAWPMLAQDTTEEIRIATLEALPEAAGGYLTVYFRVEMPDAVILDIIEYGIPYRVLPCTDCEEDGAARVLLVRREITKRFCAIEPQLADSEHAGRCPALP